MSHTKRILIAAIHYPSASGRYIKRAFQRLGHDVRTVGPCTGNRIWGLNVQPKFIWKPDLDIAGADQRPGFHLSAARVLDALAETGWEPDLIITADSAFTVQGDSPCPHVLWGVDNHVRDYHIGERTDWDWKFLAHGSGMRMDESNSVWLPCAYDPEIHVNLIPHYQRKMHAAMLGVLYLERRELLAHLAQDKDLRLAAGLGPLFEEYAQVYNSSLVSLCRSIKGDVAQRVFEAAAMGNVILTDHCHDFEALGLEAGIHYLLYSTPEQAHHQLRGLLEGPSERVKGLIAASTAWAKGHSWDDRAQVVLKTVFSDG